MLVMPNPSKPDPQLKPVQLGPLETHLVGVLCRRQDATVRELLAAGEVTAAYTTVMTTLDRLFKKGLLDREPEARTRAFRYRLKQATRDFYRRLVSADVGRLFGAAADPALPVSYLVEAVAQHDSALLAELSRAVNRKRRELRSKELRRKEKP